MIKSVQIFDGQEALFGMALRTIVAKAAFVHIIMAGNTIVVGDTFGLLKDQQWIARLVMATIAVFLFMRATQLKASAIVIEAALTKKTTERGFVMTLSTGSGELIVVDIVVAIGTARKRNIRVLHKFLTIANALSVALPTIYFLVGASERKIRFIVIKARRWLESLKIMTLNTIRRKRLLVIVVMTSQTFLIKAEKGIFASPYFRISDILWLVALATVDDIVLPF